MKSSSSSTSSSSSKNNEEKNKPKPTKKKIRSMMRKFLGISKKEKIPKESSNLKEEDLSFEDNNRKVSSSVNQWISSDCTSQDSNEIDETEESIVSETIDDAIPIAIPEPMSASKKSSSDSEHRPVLSSKLLAQNDIKKNKANKSLTFSRHLVDIRLYEREKSWSDTSTIAADDQNHNTPKMKSAKAALLNHETSNDEDDGEWEDDTDVRPLRDLSYKELQQRAKALNVPANTKKIVMIAAIQDKEAELAGDSVTTHETNGDIEEGDNEDEEDDDCDENGIFVDSEPEFSNTWHQAGGSGDEDDETNEDEDVDEDEVYEEEDIPSTGGSKCDVVESTVAIPTGQVLQSVGHVDEVSPDYDMNTTVEEAVPLNDVNGQINDIAVNLAQSNIIENEPHAAVNDIDIDIDIVNTPSSTEAEKKLVTEVGSTEENLLTNIPPTTEEVASVEDMQSSKENPPLSVSVDFDNEDDTDHDNGEVTSGIVNDNELEPKDRAENSAGKGLVVDVDINPDDSDADDEDPSPIVALVDDFNKLDENDDASTDGDNDGLSLITSLVDDFNQNAFLTENPDPDVNELASTVEKATQGDVVPKTESTEVADISTWLNRGNSCSYDSTTDLKDLLGEVEGGDDNDNEGDDDDDDLTAAIQDFLIENHSDKVEGVDDSSKASSISSKKKNEKEEISPEVEPIISHQGSVDKDDDDNEALDYFDSDMISTVTGISQAGNSSSAGNSNSNFYSHTNPFKDDDATAISYVSTDDDRPRIIASNRSSKYSADSMMGDIILDDNILEYDSDIVSQGRGLRSSRGGRRRRRRRIGGNDDDDSTVLLQDDITTVVPEDDSTAPIPEDEILEVLAQEYQENQTRLQKSSSSAEKQGKSTSYPNDNGSINGSLLQEGVSRPPPIPAPSAAAQPRDSSFGSPSNAKYFQFVDLSGSISTDTMRDTLLSLESRLMKISPAGLHEPLTTTTNNPTPLVRNESQTSSCHGETDYFNSNIPLTKGRPDLRRIDSNKTFETVSSLGSSDAVDQKRTQILKKHADEKRRQKKHQDENLMHQREARQEARARLKENSTTAIDMALASCGRRGYTPVTDHGNTNAGSAGGHDGRSSTSNLADHFVYSTSTTPVTKSGSGSAGGSGGNGSMLRSSFQRSGSYNQHHVQVERPQLQTNYSTNSMQKRQSDTSELRSATSDIVIDTFKSRTAAALTAKNIRINSSKANSSRNLASTSSESLPHRRDSGGSSRASSASHIRSAVVIPPGTIDIYKPLPPEETLSPKPKRSTSRSHSRSRGVSSNSSIVSDNDTSSQYQASVLTSHDDENSSRGSGSLTSSTRSGRHRTHHTHHGGVVPTPAPRTTNAGRMRAAAIKERAASYMDSPNKGQSLSSPAPSTSTFTRTTAMSRSQSSRHSAPSSHTKPQSQTHKSQETQPAPVPHLTPTPKVQQRASSQIPVLTTNYSETQTHVTRSVTPSAPSPKKTTQLIEENNNSSAHADILKQPNSQSIQKVDSSSRNVSQQSVATPAAPKVAVLDRPVSARGLSITTEGLPPSYGKGTNDSGSTGASGGTSAATTPSSIVVRARALVSSRQEQRSRSNGRLATSDSRRRPTEEDERKYNISPVRPAQNPFQSII